MEQAGCFLVVVGVVFAIASFVALVIALGTRSRIEVLEREISTLRGRLGAMERHPGQAPAEEPAREAEPPVVPETVPMPEPEVPVAASPSQIPIEVAAPPFVEPEA